MAKKASKSAVKSTVKIMKEKAAARAKQIKKAKANLKKATAARSASLNAKKAAVDKMEKLLASEPKVYSDSDLRKFKEMIHQKRKETLEELDTLKESMMDVTTGEYISESSNYSLHMEQGTDAMEREKTFLFASRGASLSISLMMLLHGSMRKRTVCAGSAVSWSRKSGSRRFRRRKPVPSTRTQIRRVNAGVWLSHANGRLNRFRCRFRSTACAF